MDFYIFLQFYKSLIVFIRHRTDTISFILGTFPLNHHDILGDIRSEIRAAQRNKDRSQIIEWLAKALPDPSTEHNIARDKFEEGTGSWLIDGDRLETWSDTANSFLWLNGGGKILA